MNYGKLKQYLQNDFSIASLKEFLGESIVSSMLEWSDDNVPVFTKEKLTDMLLTIYGVNILEKSDFREALLLKFPYSDLKKLCESEIEQKMPLEQLVKKISQEPWVNCKRCCEILKLLNISDYSFEKPQDNFVFSEVINSDERFYELLDYQYIIKQKVINELNSDIELNRMLVHMPTGTGKTKTAMHIIVHHICFDLKKKGLVLWIAHTKELLMQAYSTFLNVWKHLGNGEITTYKLWGNNSDIEIDSGGIVFCGIQKLISVKKSNNAAFSKLQEHCRLIVFDEAHKITAKSTRNSINDLMVRKSGMQDRSLIGLTATPGRLTIDDRENTNLAHMFEDKIISIDINLINHLNLSHQQALNTAANEDIIQYFQERRILSKVKKEELIYPNGLSNSEILEIKTTASSNGFDDTVDFSAKSLEIIGRNRYRNQAIMKKLRMLNADNIPTIVFGCSVEHCKILSSLLTLEGIPNSLVLGEMSSTDRKNAIDKFKDRDDNTNIIINYEVLTTGFDSTNIKCVFITRPTQSIVLYSQMLGRGLRGPQMGGNEECLLVDIKDNLSAFDENMAFKHFDNYWKG